MSQDSNTPRDSAGRWKKGCTGNAKGRPPGAGRIARMREALADDVPAILTVLKEQALAGDVGAARLLLERALPPLRALEPAAELPDLPESASPAEVGRAVINAAASGEVSPSQAAALLGAVASLARVIEVSELEARIQALEAAAAPGGAHS